MVEGNEQEQGNQQQMPINQNYQTPLQSYGSSILYLTNPEPLIQEMILTLRNQIKDDNGNIITMGEPLLNDFGINMMVGYVRSLMNQVTIMSNLDENEISRLVLRLADSIVKDLMINKKAYNIENDTKRSFIVDYVTGHGFIAMKRAIAGAGNEKSFWKGSSQEITMRTQEQGKAQSFWNKMADWS